MIPILSTDPTVKRYRYTSLYLPFRDRTRTFSEFIANPDPFCCRSLDEWSTYFGFEVRLMDENDPPALIGWEPAEGHNR
jgi:hypothetical protein